MDEDPGPLELPPEPLSVPVDIDEVMSRLHDMSYNVPVQIKNLGPAGQEFMMRLWLYSGMLSGAVMKLQGEARESH